HYLEKIFDQVGHRFDLRLCLKGVSREDLISDVGVFEELDFTVTNDNPEYDREVVMRLTKDKRLDGFLVWLNLETCRGELLDILDHEHCWLPVYFPVFYPGIDVSAGDWIEAVISSRLVENGLNPEYKVAGRLIRKRGGEIRFEYNSHHNRPVYKSTAFYEKIFADEQNGVNAADDQPVLESQQLREYLKEKIPDYMVPTVFVILDQFPLNTSGKVDRKCLPAPEVVRPGREDTFVAPGSLEEEALTQIWAEVLGI